MDSWLKGGGIAHTLGKTTRVGYIGVHRGYMGIYRGYIGVCKTEL